MYRYLFVALVLAAPAFAQNQSVDARAAAGCGPADINFSVKTDKKQHAVTPPAPGKAMVYVIEEEVTNPGTILPGHITTRVGLDGNWVGANHGASYLSFAVEPGDHRVCSDWQSIIEYMQKLSGAANLAAEPGKSYYFHVYVFTGDNQNQPYLTLEQVDEAQGLLLVSKSALSTSKAKK